MNKFKLKIFYFFLTLRSALLLFKRSDKLVCFLFSFFAQSKKYFIQWNPVIMKTSLKQKLLKAQQNYSEICGNEPCYND